MFSSFNKNPLLRFLVIAFGLYVGWYLLYEFVLIPHTRVDNLIIENLIYFSAFALQMLGYTTFSDGSFGEDIRTLGIDGTHGVWVGDPCNGLTLFALFAIFVIAYPGPIRKKLWYIPLGLATIHLINIIRITVLIIIVKKSPEYLEFNHTYTFTIVVYGFVFFLWHLWANKLSKKPH